MCGSIFEEKEPIFGRYIANQKLAILFVFNYKEFFSKADLAQQFIDTYGLKGNLFDEHYARFQRTYSRFSFQHREAEASGKEEKVSK